MDGGWRTAIGGMAYKKTVAGGVHYFVWPPWTMDDSHDGSNEIDEQFSFLLPYRGNLQDGRQILNVVQHSLVRPEVVSTLFQVVVGQGQQYDVIRCCYLDTGTMACIFEVFWTNPLGRRRTIPVVLMDKFTKQHRTLLLARPRLETHALAIWRENATENSLNVLYFTWDNSNEQQNEEKRVELHHVRYDIPPDDASLNETGIQPRSWQSIAFPDRDSTDACAHLQHEPPAIVLNSPANVRVLVFDRSLGTWRVVTPDQWMAMLREDNHSSAVIKAAEGIIPLSPCTQKCRCIAPISNILKRLHRSVHSTGSVYLAGTSAILQFSSTPPSLKRLAAESLCAGNRAFNRAKLKNAIGFDILDGMADSNDQPNWPVIYL